MAERQEQLTPKQLAILQKYDDTPAPPTPGLTEAQRSIVDKYQPTTANSDLTSIQDANLYRGGNYPPLSGTLRAGAQGLTLGFGEEIEAMIRSAIPGGPEYEQARDQLRQEIGAFRQAYPGTAITAEILGAMATNLIPGVAAVRSGQLAKTTMPRLMGVGATEGGIYGLGTSEREGIGQTAVDVGTATAIGAAAPLAIVGGPRAAIGIFKKVSNFVSEKFGTRYSDTVSAYLNSLAQQMGKSVDDIVADIAEGKMVTDNETANAAVITFIREGGEGANILLQYIRDRAKNTTGEAVSTVRAALAPGRSDDVLNSYLDDIDRLRERESQAYDIVFKNPDNQQVTGQIYDSVETILKRFPEVRDELEAIYTSRNLVPLFAMDKNGAIRLVRTPSVEDAEIAYRVLRDEGNKLYVAGSGTRGGIYKEYAEKLKNNLDNTYEDLAQTRANYSQQFKQQEAFDEGLKSLGKNVDLTARALRGYNAEEQMAFRAGVFAAIRDKLRRSKNTIANLADEDHQLGDLLRLVAPEETLDDLDKTLNIAAEARRTAQAAPARAGSQTAVLQRQRQREAALPVTAQEIRAAVAGDPVAMINVAQKAVGSMLGDVEISQADRATIANILVSEDPEMLVKAMVNENAMDQLRRKITSMASTISPGLANMSMVPSSVSRIAERLGGGLPTGAGQQVIQGGQGILSGTPYRENQ
jgi:hypothetical protein